MNPAPRPNLLLLFCDQLRADALGCYGHPFALTPALDQLAAGAQRYTHAWTPSPVSVSSRHALLTGCGPWQSGVCDNAQPCSHSFPSFIQHLSDAGYRTHGIGKMHFEPDLYALRGFQTREVGEESGDYARDDYMRHLNEQGWGRVRRPHGQRDTAYYLPQLSPVPAELHPSHWVADRSIAFLEDVNPEQPFFLWSSFIHPHPPFTPPEPWHLLFPPAMMPDPFVPAFAEDLWTVHQAQQNRYKGQDSGQNRRLSQLQQAYYHACVAFLDAQVGRILQALEAKGLRENTLIVFTSDHGEFLGDYGCLGKRSFLRPSARLPLLVSGPGFTPGVLSRPTDLMDLAPTFLQLAQAAPLPECEGIALQNPDGHEVLYGQFSSGPLAVYHVAQGADRYIFSEADRKEILFCSDWDPTESRNLAPLPQTRTRLRELRELALHHFPALAGRDLESECLTGRMRLGGPDPEPSRIAQLDAYPDAGLLGSGDPLSSDPRFQFYARRARFTQEGAGNWKQRGDLTS